METKRHLTPEDSIIQTRLSSSRIKTCLKEEPEIDSLVDVHNIDISVKQEDSDTISKFNEVESSNTSLEDTNINDDNYSSEEEPNIDTIESISRYVCQHCKIKFVTRILYAAHMSLEHKVNSDDLNFYCQPCDTKYPMLGAFRRHLRNVHKMKLTPIKATPVRNIEPDPKDPNLHCQSCDIEYSKLNRYRQHLRRVHKMNLKPLILISNPNPSIEPDPNDSNFYCQSCTNKYPSKSVYWRHLRRRHKINLPYLRKSKNIIECDPPNDMNP